MTPADEEIAQTWHMEYEGWILRKNKQKACFEIVRYNGDGPISEETVKVIDTVPIDEEHRAECKFSVMRDSAAAQAVRKLFEEVQRS